MKGLISSHKTPKFGDLSPDILKGNASIHSEINKKKKISMSNSNKYQNESVGAKKSELNKMDAKENKEKIPPIPPSKKADFLDKKVDKILKIQESNIEKVRSKSTFDYIDAKDLKIFQDKTNENMEITTKPSSRTSKETNASLNEKPNIKEKIDFINQMFDSINTKCIKTEIKESPKKLKDQINDSFENEDQDEEEDIYDINPRESRVFPEKIQTSAKVNENYNFNKEIKKKSSKENFDKYQEKDSISPNLGNRANYSKKTIEKNSSNEDLEKSYERKSSLFVEKNYNYQKPNYTKASFLKEKSEKPSQSPLKKNIIKNFIQANKRNNGLGKKMYENYEKILKIFDQESIYQKKEVNSKSNNVSKSPIRKTIMPSKSPAKIKPDVKKNYVENQEVKKSSRSSLTRDTRKISNKETERIKNNDLENVDMKTLYNEISHLTKTLNKAADLMKETFIKIEKISQTPMKRKKKEVSSGYSSNDDE